MDSTLRYSRIDAMCGFWYSSYATHLEKQNFLYKCFKNVRLSSGKNKCLIFVFNSFMLFNTGI